MVRQVPYQGVSKLTPIASRTADANGDNIEMATVVLTTAGIAFGCACFLQFNLRFCAIAYGLNFNSYSHSRKRYNSEVMHPINIMALIAGQPAFSAGDAKLSLEMNFCDGTFQGHLQAKSFVDSIEQFLGSQAIF